MNVADDLRYGLRLVRRKPWSSLAILVMLAVGVGLSTAFFSVVHGVLLRPLPYAEPDRLVMLFEDNPVQGWSHLGTSPPNFGDYRRNARSLAGLAAATGATVNLTGSGDPERLSGARVTAGFFEVLGVEPALGRTFSVEEDRPGTAPVVVLSHGLWRERFGADPAILGRTVTFDDGPVTVVGVMGPGFRHPGDREPGATRFWLPLAESLEESGNRSIHYLSMIGRLAPGVSVERAREEMGALAGQLAEQYPDSNEGLQVSVVPLREELVGDVRRALLVLFAATGLVLLIACANAANLLLSRALARDREMATRAAVGGGRARLVRQLLAEGVVLALLAGAAAVVLAMLVTRLLVRFAPADVPRLASTTLDPVVLAYAVGTALVTGVLATLLPVWRLRRPALAEVLGQEGARGGTGRRRRFAHGALVVAEVALALVLLVAAGLMIRSFRNLMEVDPGFDPSGVVALRISLPESRYGENARKIDFYDRLVERVGALPEIESAGAINHLPLRGVNVSTLWRESVPTAPGGQMPMASYRVVGGDYFRTVGIPLVQGRLFNEFDREDAPGAAIVDEAMARAYWPDGSALGERISFAGPEGPWHTIVGIVGGVRDFALASPPWFTMYVPYRQDPWLSMSLVARAAGRPESALQPMVRQVWSIDPEQPVYEVSTLEGYVAEAVAAPRFNMLLLSLFAGVAVLLALFGVYSVLTYSVSQRQREIGVRMALGAQRGSIVADVLRRGMTLAAIGVVLGLGAAWAVTRFLATLLFEVEATDVATFAVLTTVLLAVAAVACYLPARRVYRFDPATTLRHD
ncbi:MAG TPA: ABC transporter permease [Thermoanaerobaculia bacterium]|nr:ABC transporter permease [Thermoanaerobaculia bacterium]